MLLKYVLTKYKKLYSILKFYTLFIEFIRALTGIKSRIRTCSPHPGA